MKKILKKLNARTFDYFFLKRLLTKISKQINYLFKLSKNKLCTKTNIVYLDITFVEAFQQLMKNIKILIRIFLVLFIYIYCI